MLGLLYFTIIGIIAIIGIVRNSFLDSEYKKTSRINGTNLYRDHDLVARDIDTGKAYSYHINRNGDRIIKDIKTNETVNLSQKEREEEYERRKKKPNDNEIAVLIKKNTYEDAKQPNHVPGNVYKDIETGDLYVKRHFNGCVYYMNLYSQQLVYNARNGRKLSWRDEENIELYNRKYAGTSADRIHVLPGEI